METNIERAWNLIDEKGAVEGQEFDICFKEGEKECRLKLNWEDMGTTRCLNKCVVPCIQSAEGTEKRAFLKSLKQACSQKKADGDIWPHIGWNAFSERKVFAFSNCVITRKGLDRNSYADIEGYCLEGAETFQWDSREWRENVLLRMCVLLGDGPDEFLPVFFSNMAAALNLPLAKENLSPNLLLWLAGSPGSGKTEVALNLGTYVNRGEGYDRIRRVQNLVSANVKPRVIADRLECCHSNVCVPTVL